MRKIVGAAGLAALALALSACGSSSSSSSSSAATNTNTNTAPAAGATTPASSAAATSTLDTKTINGTPIVTNASGMTLYWFVPDTKTTSNCTGACATYWPPVAGPATAGSGVTGTLGTITRSDGSKQATYDGHPLYTYIGDKSPGQATGNGKNLSGGVWWEMTVSGATPSAGTTSTSTSTGGGGYGY